ncbi:MAG: diguanylate cyclase [Erysipelotrichales bacterium]|nr:diguanylate cyclase [Erysipelotrichales bacterium]
MRQNKLLIVDDSDFNRALLKQGLSDDYEIIEAVDGQMALDILQIMKVDVVLLDIVMPKMDGLTVLRKIRADKELRALPVLVISAFEGVEREIECLDAGADDVIRKPIDNRVMKLRIENILIVRSAKKIERLRSKMDSVLNSINCGILRLKYHMEVTEFNGEYEFANDEFFRVRKLKRKEFLKDGIVDGYGIDPEDYENVIEIIKESVVKGKSNTTYSYRLNIDGEVIYMECTATITCMGGNIYLDIVERNVTEQRRLSTQLREAETLISERSATLDKLTDLVPNGLAFLKATSESVELVGVNQALASHFGYSKDEYTQLFKDDFINKGMHPDDALETRSAITKLISNEEAFNNTVRLKGRNGEYHWVQMRVSILEKYVDTIYAFAVFMDIEELKMLADRDPLTKLFNRHAFKDAVARDLQRGFDSEYVKAMIVIDLDNFKSVNDTFGHAYGDKVLEEAARILTGIFRSGDYVARVGGDEFCVFINSITREAAIARATQVCEKFQRSFEENGKRVSTSCSLGVAFAPDAGNTYDELFKKADEAQYVAKRSGKARFVIWEEK